MEAGPRSHRRRGARDDGRPRCQGRHGVRRLVAGSHGCSRRRRAVPLARRTGGERLPRAARLRARRGLRALGPQPGRA
eukprot:9339754-Lingulodinium_polyedra.AAC.1